MLIYSEQYIYVYREIIWWGEERGGIRGEDYIQLMAVCCVFSVDDKIMKQANFGWVQNKGDNV